MIYIKTSLGYFISEDDSKEAVFKAYENNAYNCYVTGDFFTKIMFSSRLDCSVELTSAHQVNSRSWQKKTVITCSN